MTQGTRGTARLPNQVLEPQRVEAGLTLIELLVVVFLLGLLAQAAVLATAGALEEAQQQTTQQTLAQLEIALLGQPQRLDSLGRPNYGGFVADIGGLPMHRGGGAGDTPEEALAVAMRELWMRPESDPDGLRDLHPFGLQDTDLDSEVLLACGWRGPYLRLGVGVAALRDGWGNAYLPFDKNGVPSVLGGEVAAVLSFGADVQAAGDGYSADLSLLVEATGALLSPLPVPARHRGDVTVQVSTLAGSDDVLVVRVYGPLADSPGVAAGTLGLVRQVELSLVGQWAPGNRVSVPLTNLTIGPRVVCAYQTADSVPSTVAVPSGPRSRPLQITVEPYAIQPLQLTIQGS